MNTSAVIKLSCQAAETVLRFRATGFASRPTIDQNSFRAAIITQIEKMAKDHRHRFEIPLSEVVTYAGTGAARAAQQWNDICHAENRVAAEWFRSCVCDLVSGVVNEIGQMAFEDQGINACMYIEPGEYDPFDAATYTSSRPVSTSTSYIPASEDDYYGFQQTDLVPDDEPVIAPTSQFTSFQAASTALQPAPLRHEIEKGYKALEQLAASQKDSSAQANFIQSTKRLRDASEPAQASDQDATLKRPAKRARRDSPSSRSSVSPVKPVPARNAGSKSQKWTEHEVSILVTARDCGRGWSQIADMLPRHTLAACQTKHRLVKHQEPKPGPNGPTVATEPAASHAGQNTSVEMVQNGKEGSDTLEDVDNFIDDSPATLTRFSIRSLGTDDFTYEGDGENSVAAGGSNAGDEDPHTRGGDVLDQAADVTE